MFSRIVKFISDPKTFFSILFLFTLTSLFISEVNSTFQYLLNIVEHIMESGDYFMFSLLFAVDFRDYSVEVDLVELQMHLEDFWEVVDPMELRVHWEDFWEVVDPMELRVH